MLPGLLRLHRVQNVFYDHTAVLSGVEVEVNGTHLAASYRSGSLSSEHAGIIVEKLFFEVCCIIQQSFPNS